jgi:polar amino acid transport system substrate-binding protein
MKKIIFVFALFTCIFFSACEKKIATPVIANSQPVYDQVDKTQTLRCGYVTWPPAFVMNVNDKTKSGIFYDVTQEVGKRLNLKIEWTEELSWATVVEALKTKRVDAVCSGLWANSARARQVDFSAPVTFSKVNAYKSAKSTKQFTTLADLDKPEVTFGYIDGTTPAKLTPQKFPHAKTVSYPEMTQVSDLLQGLQTGKYDVMMVDEASVQNFLKISPGTVVKAVEEPVAVFPNVMLLPAGETKLKAIIDNTIREMTYDGTIKAILDKNQVTQDYQLPAKPYQD